MTYRAGLSEDQEHQLTALEQQGQLTDWDKGTLAGLRMCATTTEAERIDRLTGHGPAAAAHAAQQQTGQQQTQSGPAAPGPGEVCPTCGHRRGHGLIA